MVGVLLLLVVLAYAGAVDDHGSDRVQTFWGRTDKAPREVVLEVDYSITPKSLHRFGHQFGEKHE
jgi:hypothetical protein